MSTFGWISELIKLLNIMLSILENNIWRIIYILIKSKLKNLGYLGEILLTLRPKNLDYKLQF